MPRSPLLYAVFIDSVREDVYNQGAHMGIRMIFSEGAAFEHSAAGKG